MAQFYSGQHGEMYVKTSGIGSLAKVGNLKSWSITFQLPVLETTCLRDTDRTILPGVRSFSGSSSLLYYSDEVSNVRLMTRDGFYNKYNKDNNGNNPNSKKFGQNAPAVRTNVVLRLFDGNTRDMDFDCFITNFEISCSVGEVVTANFSFEGHGAPKGMTMIT